MKIFRVKVRPASRQQLFRREEDGSLTVHLKSPPIDGKANQELIQVLANAFRVSKSSVRIKSGAAAKNKWVEIDMDE